MSQARSDFDPSTIERPHPRLLTYYFIVSLLTFVAFPVTFLVLYIQYRTLRYRFDDDGAWRRQGLLWRREVNVAYRRIQDIHLTNGLIQRWLGLATVSIQTAAGSATAEVTIEGVLEAEALRDFLYTKMRGVRDGTPGAAIAARGGTGDANAGAAGVASAGAAAGADANGDEALALLTDIRDSLRRLEGRLGSSDRPS